MKNKKFMLAIILSMVVFLLVSCGQKPPVENTEQWIDVVDSIDLSGMNLYWQKDSLQFAADDNAKLSMYVNAEKDANGNLAFDDGQDWLLLMETSLGDYPIFPRKYVQIGEVRCSVFIDKNDDFHIIVTVLQTAGYQIYDCVFDNGKKAFKLETLYNAEGINLIVAENDLSASDSSVSNSNISAKKKPFVSVNFATDELLSNYGSFGEFKEFEDAGYQKIVFTANAAIKDFRFIEIGYKEEDSNITFFENSVLYSIDELLPEKPLVVTWMEQGDIIPYRGITFADENDTTRYFYISTSGEDGSKPLKKS